MERELLQLRVLWLESLFWWYFWGYMSGQWCLGLWEWWLYGQRVLSSCARGVLMCLIDDGRYGISQYQNSINCPFTCQNFLPLGRLPALCRKSGWGSDTTLRPSSPPALGTNFSMVIEVSWIHALLNLVALFFVKISVSCSYWSLFKKKDYTARIWLII
jgi:hypothetical protein